MSRPGVPRPGLEVTLAEKSRTVRPSVRSIDNTLHAALDAGFGGFVGEDVKVPLLKGRKDSIGDGSGFHGVGHDSFGESFTVFVHHGGPHVQADSFPVAVGIADGGFDKTGAQDRYPDRGVHHFQIPVQGLGQSHHAVLGNIIGTHAGRGDQTGEGCCVHNVAGLLLHHTGHEYPDPVDHAEKVNPKDEIPLFGRGFPAQTTTANTGIIAEQVDVLKGTPDLFAQGIHGLFIGHIRDDGQDLHSFTFNGRGGLVQRFFFNIHQDRVHAGFGKAMGHRQTDATGGSGNHSYFILEIFHSPPRPAR